MPPFSLIFFFLLPWQLCTSSNTDSDRIHLHAVKSAIDDSSSSTTSWDNNTLSVCLWEGVTCSPPPQRRVVSLNLDSRNLRGTLSPHIANLTFLRRLILSNNSLSGRIPSSLGRLIFLQVLDLRNNSFHGVIPPTLSSCTHLQYLALSTNLLSGIIPPDLGSLTKLKALALHRNMLTGAFPSSVANLTSLEGISMAENLLRGGIPEELFHRLKKLRILALGSNLLSGPIPFSIYNLSSLTVFSISFNSFHGRLPSGFGLHFPRLQVLEVEANLLTGPIPSSFSNCSNLKLISMASNRFSGRVSVDFSRMQSLTTLAMGNNTLGSSTTSVSGEDIDEMSFLSTLSNCSNLFRLSIGSNQFKGKLPSSSSMANFSHLSSLVISKNQITGPLPSWVTSISSLTLLSASGNHFTGMIPLSIAALHKLQVLDLASNALSGDIPSSLSNLSYLSELYLYQNLLQGAIPPNLGYCTYLQALDLSQNNLGGTFPTQLLQPTTLVLINLSHNSIIGPIPSDIGSLRSLWELDLSNNNMSGEIPTTVGHCTSLNTFIIKENQFQGSLPSSLSSLKSIQLLDLSRNRLEGRIPEFLATMAFLQFLNLSFNQLEGVVPTNGIFTNRTAVSLYGNKGLCGGPPNLHMPTCEPEETEKTTRGRRITIPPAFIITVAILSALILLLALVLPPRSQKKQKEKLESLVLKKVSYTMLHRATNGFSAENLIGRGSFGSVYRGVLEEEGHGRTAVAVKVLDLHRRGAGKSFKAECDAVRNTRHRNLVRMITSCSSLDYKGNEFKALVCTLMAEGSLERWLHSSVKDGTGRRLGFMERVNVAIDVASALEYLHHHCRPPLIHYDLKPSNVLLDSDLTACVGDFGLARFATRKITAESSSAGAFGTVGYTAPEYGLGNEASTSGDVYSFGIVILEMLTGKRPTEGIFQGDDNIHKYAKAALAAHEVEEIVDPLLLDEPTTPASSDTKTDCLLSLFNIGVTSSAECPQDRKDMTAVLCELHSIRDALKKAGVPPYSLHCHSVCPSPMNV